MMNKHGQTLILFVLLLPLLLLLLAFVVDVGTILLEKTKLDSTLRTVLKTTYKEKEETDYNEKVITLLKENKIPTDAMQIEVKENYVRITIYYEKESIFGKVIGIDAYPIKSTYRINNELKVIKE